MRIFLQDNIFLPIYSPFVLFCLGTLKEYKYYLFFPCSFFMISLILFLVIVFYSNYHIVSLNTDVEVFSGLNILFKNIHNIGHGHI